jgi:hypothetical protein
MKPCPKNRERIAWLAMDALAIKHEHELRAHLEICAGCRSYLDEISAVAGRLRAAEPQPAIQPSASFHGKVIGEVAMAQRRSAVETLLPQIWFRWNWRIAVPAAGAVALIIATWWFAAPRDERPMPSRLANLPFATPELKSNLEPTFANYEMAARQSLDKLDELLTEQGKINTAPSPNDTTTLNSRLDTAD